MFWALKVVVKNFLRENLLSVLLLCQLSSSPYKKRLKLDLPTSSVPPPPYLSKNVALTGPPL
jgi:hypothetical protein